MSDYEKTNVTDDSELKFKLASLYSYLAIHLQIREPPKVVLTNSRQNSINPFGLTGYYDPVNKIIRLYVTNRHQTDILRSFAHEVVHHWQNQNGTLRKGDGKTDTSPHYAQYDLNLRKREMEAYLFGNILFRDWQDENRYGPPSVPPVMPQPINENLAIQNSMKLKDGFKKLLKYFIYNGTIGSYHRELTSGDMNPEDFVNDFANKLVTALNTQIQTINDRGNWENQPYMIKEIKTWLKNSKV